MPTASPSATAATTIIYSKKMTNWNNNNISGPLSSVINLLVINKASERFDKVPDPNCDFFRNWVRDSESQYPF